MLHFWAGLIYGIVILKLLQPRLFPEGRRCSFLWSSPVRNAPLPQPTHTRTCFVPSMFCLATACSALATHCATLFYMPDYRTSFSVFIGCSCSCSFTTAAAAGYIITTPSIWCTFNISCLVLWRLFFLVNCEQIKKKKKTLLEASIAVVSKLIWNNISLIVFLSFLSIGSTQKFITDTCFSLKCFYYLISRELTLSSQQPK